MNFLSEYNTTKISATSGCLLSGRDGSVGNFHRKTVPFGHIAGGMWPNNMMNAEFECPQVPAPGKRHLSCRVCRSSPHPCHNFAPTNKLPKVAVSVHLKDKKSGGGGRLAG